MSTLSGGPNIIVDGLVLYLDAANSKSYIPGSTTWNDVSRLGNNGTLVNGPTFNSADGGYIVFDGVNDFITLGDILALGFTDGVFTADAWVYVPSTWTAGSQYPNLISKGASAGWDNAGWSLFVFRDYPGAGIYGWGCGIRNGATSLITQGSINITPNTFTHICVTADGSNVRLYQNSVLTNTNSQTVNPELNSQSVLIGKDWTNNYFPGNVAITRLYNRAISSSEVRQNFNSTRSRFGI
jgi:hypothetical protein